MVGGRTYRQHFCDQSMKNTGITRHTMKKISLVNSTIGNQIPFSGESFMSVSASLHSPPETIYQFEVLII
jgi:hypothetical protein